MKQNIKLRPDALSWFRAMRVAQEFTELSSDTLLALESRIFVPVKKEPLKRSSNSGPKLNAIEQRISSHKQPAQQAARDFLIQFDPVNADQSAKLLLRWESLFGSIYEKLPISIRKYLLVCSGDHRSLSKRFMGLKKLHIEGSELNQEEKCLLSLGFLVKQDTKSMANILSKDMRSIAKNKAFLNYIIEDKFNFTEEVAKLLMRAKKMDLAKSFLGHLPTKERLAHKDILHYLGSYKEISPQSKSKAFNQWVHLPDLEKERTISGFFAELERGNYINTQTLAIYLSTLKKWCKDERLKLFTFQLVAKNISNLAKIKVGTVFLKQLTANLFSPIYADLWAMIRHSKSKNNVAVFFRSLAKVQLLLVSPRFEPREVVSLYRSYESSISFQSLKSLYLPWSGLRQGLVAELKKTKTDFAVARRKILALSICQPRRKITKPQLAMFVGVFGFDPFSVHGKKPDMEGERSSDMHLYQSIASSAGEEFGRDKAWLVSGIRHFRKPAMFQQFKNTGEFKPSYAKMNLEKTSAWLMSDFPPRVQKVLSFWLGSANFRLVLNHVSSETMRAKDHPIFHRKIHLQKVAFHLSSLGWVSRSDRISCPDMTTPFAGSQGYDTGAILVNYLWCCLGFDLLTDPSKIRFKNPRFSWFVGTQKSENLIIRARSIVSKVNEKTLLEYLPIFALRLACLFHKHPTHLLHCVAKERGDMCDLKTVSVLERWILSKHHLRFREKAGLSIKTPIG